ncbi:hypothetical protein KXW60_006018 [Aspergillus fumigatus]|nr:hypothetical protein KXW60_006018 [Aspergillus fumigatus]KAH3275137.1 hypothetical protein KXW55_007230 [Aspergillus fumigatus]
MGRPSGLLLSISALLAAVLSPAAAAKNGSTLFKGGTIIAFNEKKQDLDIIRGGSLLISDGIISAITEGAYDKPLPPGTEIVDATGDILTPGFIDTHGHGWQTAYRTIGSNTTLAEYFNRYGEFAADGIWSADDVYVSQLTGLYEALNAGVTTTLDHAHHTWSKATTDAGVQASIDSGARVFWCFGFHNVSNFLFEQQLAKFQELADSRRFSGQASSLGIAYDAFNPGSAQQTESIIQLAMDYNVSVVTTHSLPKAYGVSLTMRAVINSPEDLHALGFLNSSVPIVFSHASFLTPTGARLLRETNQYISITAESEMHYGHDHPYNHMIQDQASLGVDTHFTFSTDILTQARIWLQYVRLTLYRWLAQNYEVATKNPMSVDQAFLLATRSGGLALHRPDLGVLSVGAAADVVVWDGSSPGMLGWHDPVAAVMLHAGVGDVKHVMVDGKMKKRDGKLLVPKYQDLQRKFVDVAKRIQSTWLAMPPTVLEGDFAMSGYPLAVPPLADVVRGDESGY